MWTHEMWARLHHLPGKSSDDAGIAERLEGALDLGVHVERNER